ncbi:hypothetical protein B0T22DRAFT_165664 [Podospora appendiculata]|uniref:3'(2'),5'-bisphosphate nucleotidase n=1 Tax=Podospora appendiculata TaxID=314037 RepID=A0AAE0XB94_9PEZI|nr:hypothetical protein B0T22DRAFT_165664 [Podospora appendiculata]
MAILHALPYAHERRIAELAVQRASVVAKNVCRSTLRAAISKLDASPVTIADFAAQALLISAIHAAFPADGFVGEEDASTLRADPQLANQVWNLVSTAHLDNAESDALLATPATVAEMCEVIDLGGRGNGGRTGRFWALDPIDGTAAFIKNQQYAVSLALIEDGREVLGVLGCPNLSPSGPVTETNVDADGMGLMLSAVRHQGAVTRPMGPGALQPAREISRASEGTVEPKDVHFIDSKATHEVRSLAREIKTQYPGTELYSSHMRYVALILGGRTRAHVRIPKTRHAASYIWDHAGAQLIYTESGREKKVTDLQGKEIDFGGGRQMSENWGVVAADETVHARILEVVGEVLRRR